MHQTTINFDSTEQVRRSINLRATIVRKYSQLSIWLHGRSEFYSRIADFSISRLTVIRVNMVTACLLVCAFAIEHSPIAAIVTAICAGWLVYRLNKKGGRK